MTTLNSEHVHDNNKSDENAFQHNPDASNDNDTQNLIEIDLTIDHNERHWHIVYTIALNYCFISVGFCYSIFNPTLVELSEIYDTNLEGISKIFPVRSIGTTLGTLSIGFLTYYVNRQILLFSALLLKALTVFLVPQWNSLQGFCINGFFNGFFTSAIVVMVNVWLNEIWSQSARQRRLQQRTNAATSGAIESIQNETINIGNILMQALHFFFGLGCILGPLLAEPFLKNSFINSSGFFRNSLVLPFTICSFSAVLSSLSLFVLYIIVPYEQLKKTDSQSNIRSDSDTEQSNKLNLLKNCVFLLSGLYLMVFIFSEGTYFQFSASFTTQTKLHLNEPTAAILASTLAASFTITRGLSILIATKLTPGTMIFLDLCIVLAGNTIVYFFCDTNLPLLTSGFVMLGCGFASVFPSFFPFLEYHNFIVTDFVGALLTFSGGISEVLAPFVIGLYIDTMPMILVYCTFVSVLLSTIVLTLLYLLIKSVKSASHNFTVQNP